MDTSQWSRAHLAQCDFILEVSTSTNTIFPSEFTVTDMGLGRGDGGELSQLQHILQEDTVPPGTLAVGHCILSLDQTSEWTEMT